jgi:hypothetical protein
VEVFEKFVDSLENQTKILVTTENVEPHSLLAKEFCFEELQSECLKGLPDPISSLSVQISKLEEQIESQERRLDNLCHEIEEIVGVFTEPEKLVKSLDFPLKDARSLEGIISFLTKKHGGNVHEKGIVTITSKSVHRVLRTF